MSRTPADLTDYRTFYENLPGIALTLAVQGTIQFVNAYGSKRLGHQREALINQPVFSLLQMDEGDRLRQDFLAFVQSSALTLQQDWLFQDQNGQGFWSRVSLQKIQARRASKSRPHTLILAIAVEIPQPHRFEIPLPDHEAEFKALAETLPVAVVVSRFKDGEILYANSQFSQSLNLSLPQIIGQKMLDFYLNPQDRKSILENLTQTGIANSYEIPIKRNDHEELWVNMSVKFLVFAGERAILNTFQDITEQKLALEALKQQTEQDHILGTLRDRIRQSLDYQEILTTTAAEVRQLLETDRVVIFQFKPDWSGEVVVEAVRNPWKAILGEVIDDPCFSENYVQQYHEGRIRAIRDVYNSGLTSCYIQMLAQFQVQSNLVVPILQSQEWAKTKPSQSHQQVTGNHLWGLLIAHHCAEPRQWQEWEMELLQQLAGQVAIAINQAQLYAKLQEANHRLQRLAISDGLTKLANRRRFDEYLEQEWRQHLHKSKPLSLILADIDFFKLYNDNYGHLAGDFCLQKVAVAIRQTVNRSSDLVARYGGEEFAIILPHTSVEEALVIAESIKLNVKTLELTHNKSPYQQVTLSLGVASRIPTLETSPEMLVTASDQALYRAKAAGRNCAIAAD